MLYVWSPTSPLDSGKQSGLVTSKKGVVAAENKICSDVGADILRINGSAVDAAIAATLCMGVTNMYSSGIGGGGFMLIRSSSGRYESIDFREQAPAAAYTNMYDKDPKLAQVGTLAVGVPGELYGLQTAHQKYGKLPWSTLVQPAIKLSRDGWPVHPDLQYRLDISKDWILSNEEFRKVFAPNGKLLRTGELITRPTYAKTLESIAADGIKPFYEGWIADEIIKTVVAGGGILTHADLKAYRTDLSPAISSTYRGYTVTTTPPPTSGAVLLSSLNIIEGYDFDDTPLAVHRLVESWKYGYSQRSYYGDPTDPIYRNITAISNLSIEKQTADILRHNISDLNTFEPEYYKLPFDVLDDHGTMHLSVLNADGEAVTLTSTVNLLFGSRVMDAVTGIILNDQMDDFSIPGVSNAFGLAPSPYNFIHPGKRPLSSSVPTIFEKDGHVKAVAGASGGSHIITSTLQTLINMIDLDQDPAAAVHHPRVHHQLIPNTKINRQMSVLYAHCSQITWLNRGEYKSGVQAIKRLPDGTLQAASDSRKGGVAAAV
eukprot:jgi/Hompol1/5586/HPOL_002002-RA